MPQENFFRRKEKRLDLEKNNNNGKGDEKSSGEEEWKVVLDGSM